VVNLTGMRSARALLSLAGLALAWVSAAPARAESAPHWYENGKLIVGSVSVQARGWMRFEPPSTQSEPNYVRCRNVVASWTLTNPSTGEAGTGELSALTASACRARPIRCAGASAGFGGIPKSAPLIRKGSEVTESLEDMSMGAECSTGGFGGGGREAGYLEVAMTRQGIMHLFGTFYPCNPHEYPICVFHPALAHGKLALPNNITAR
jgi:hypothetical protein